MSTLKVNDIVDTGGHSLLGRRNLIINGGFDVWQRGTSFSGLSAYAYCADRWQCAGSTAVLRSTDVPSDEGFAYSGQFSGAAANDNFVRMMLEDSHRILGSKDFTLSFWIKGSTSSTGFVDVNDEQGQNFSITTSWTKVTKTFTPINAHVHGGTANDFFDIKTDTVSTVYITGVQLEVGSVATPFEHRSYGEELALCQRYYQQYDYTDVYQTVLAPTFNISTSDAFGTFFFAVPMRVTPSFSTNGAGNFRLNNNSVDEVCSNVYHQTPTVYGTAIRFVKTTANLPNGGISYVNTQLGNDASLRFDAEL